MHDVLLHEPLVFAPSPLRGEGWGEGERCVASLANPPLSPSPSPTEGGGEQRNEV
jgi:hypothetical protein